MCNSVLEGKERRRLQDRTLHMLMINLLHQLFRQQEEEGRELEERVREQVSEEVELVMEPGARVGAELEPAVGVVVGVEGVELGQEQQQVVALALAQRRQTFQ